MIGRASWRKIACDWSDFISRASIEGFFLQTCEKIKTYDMKAVEPFFVLIHNNFDSSAPDREQVLEQDTRFN